MAEPQVPGEDQSAAPPTPVPPEDRATYRAFLAFLSCVLSLGFALLMRDLWDLPGLAHSLGIAVFVGIGILSGAIFVLECRSRSVPILLIFVPFPLAVAMVSLISYGTLGSPLPHLLIAAITGFLVVVAVTFDFLHGTWTLPDRLIVVAVLLFVFITPLPLIVRGMPALKWFAFALAPGIAGLVPELSEQRHKKGRYMMWILLILGSGFLACSEDVAKERAEQDAALRVALNEAVVRQEARQAKTITLNPRDVLKANMGSGTGFETKAKMVRLQAAEAQAVLMEKIPDQAARLLALPTDSSARLAAYRSASVALRESLARRGEDAESYQRVVDLLENETGYLRLEEYWKNTLLPIYADLTPRLDSMSTEAVRKEFLKIATRILAHASDLRLAGLLNHVGNLANGIGERDFALACLIQGLVVDPEHIPLYETLSYVFWAHHADGHVALRYADEGLKKCGHLVKDHRDRFDRIRGAYQRLRSTLPGREADLDRNSQEVEALWKELEPGIQKYESEFRDRLILAYCYHAAIVLEHEGPVKELILALGAAHPADADILDTLGFVTMRFARTLKELDESESCFIKASNVPPKDRDAATQALIDLHRQELLDKRRQLEKLIKSPKGERH